ncbi:MAG: N-acetylmuramoyl-L-alanine amidase family protein [Candidatus Methylomirabilia bacterium]
MIARFARSREERMKRAIFRGVIEDNLSLLGRTTARAYVRKRLPRAAKIALFAATLVLGILFTGSSLSPVIFSVQQIQARFVAPAPTPTPAVQPPGLDPALFKGGRGLPLSKAFGLGVKTILLDPGHGGEDTGAIGRGGTLEKEIALDIARRLKRRLQSQTSAEVLLTRDADLTLPLGERIAIAHASHADLFVSIHLNFVPNKPINIIETFYFGPGTDTASLELARRENSGQGPGMSELREIIERMETQLRREESPKLAAAIQSSLYRNSHRENSGVLDYGTKRGPFAVLNQAEVPAVLAEVSCLSNREEEERLGTPQHREDIAAYLETGILDYLRNGETMHESKK